MIWKSGTGNWNFRPEVELNEYWVVAAGSAYVVAIPDRIDHGDVAFERREQNVVGRRKEKSPERNSCAPHAADELVVDAVGWHANSVNFDSSRQQREESRGKVNHALIRDQNVHRLKERHVRG